MKQFEVGRVEVRKRNRLPHWIFEHAPYLVTWNLLDAVPDVVKQGLRREYELELRRIRMMRGSVTPADRAEIELSIRRKIEKVLDEGHGECLLRNRECAGIVADSLEHFNGERYDLSSMSVMPNHVHVIVSCKPGVTIDKRRRRLEGLHEQRNQSASPAIGAPLAGGLLRSDTSLRS